MHKIEVALLSFLYCQFMSKCSWVDLWVLYPIVSVLILIYPEFIVLILGMVVAGLNSGLEWRVMICKLK